MELAWIYGRDTQWNIAIWLETDLIHHADLRPLSYA
jgi:hypothetical protein